MFRTLHGLFLAPGVLALFALASLRCAGGTGGEHVPDPPGKAAIQELAPSVLLKGSAVWIQGTNLSAQAVHFLALEGDLDDGTPYKESFELVHEGSRLRWDVPRETVAALVGRVFSGNASIRSRNRWGEAQGPPRLVRLEFVEFLRPTLRAVAQGLAFINSKIAVEGGGLLLGAGEGTTRAELNGCFLPETVSGDCATKGTKISAAVTVAASDVERTRGSFALGPEVLGIEPGTFSGTLSLVNQQAGLDAMRSGTKTLGLELRRTRITNLDQAAASLGQFLDVRGKGFVGGTEGTTLIRFEGAFERDGGAKRPVAVELVSRFDTGDRVRYVMAEGEGLGAHVDLRRESGSLTGSWTPVIRWRNQEVLGVAAVVSLRVAPVRQVVWVQFVESWTISLQRFGLQAADDMIRGRVLEVLRRDYTGLNVEFLEQEPQHFSLYAILEIAGADLNGLGLLGYDNTPGKDVGNKRLGDRIGGVNALTQEGGFPGYGGVFADSQLSFSLRPPAGIKPSPLADALFDQIFDPTRPDVGAAVSSKEVVEMPLLQSSAGCPAAKRPFQIACAVRVLGNLIGHTASHELGHSFGLAEPDSRLTVYHNAGDLPNRMMEGGAGRPFAERAQLAGQGPAVFCEREFEYLQGLLPTGLADPVPNRPPCD